MIWLGFASLLFYYSWWFTPTRLTSPLLFLGLISALLYGAIQLAGNWVIYLAANRPKMPAPQTVPRDLSVDVFVTTFDEEVSLISRCLVAATRMEGKPRIYLLDDAGRPELEALAAQLGVDYLTREGNQDHKAGNINAALARTEGDIVVIFDVDHAPVPNFLTRTLGYFNDEGVGFVQVMLTFAYARSSSTGRAASESSLDFYNPASLGADALGSATLIGSNALLRREALKSIGGYQPGLAEDLATSIALHAAGWRSNYVNEPLAPGMAPPDLRAWFDQQFKWSRGVFELLVSKYASYWPDLTAGQRLVYAVRMTYYWIGLVTMAHLFIPLTVLFLGTPEAVAGFNQYVLHLAPLLLATLAIRSTALRSHAAETVKQSLATPIYLQLKPLLLVAGTWPIYSLSWLLALLRVPTSFRPTPKAVADRGPNPLMIAAQAVVMLLLLAGAAASAFHAVPSDYLLIATGLVAALSQSWVVKQGVKEALARESNEMIRKESQAIFKEPV